MKKIIIGFSKPKKFFKPFSWLIRLVEGTPFSHAFVKSYSNTAECYLIYQASGTAVNFMSEKQFHNAAHIVEEFEFFITEEAYKRYIKWAIQNAGVPYGLKTVLGIFIARVFNLRRNPFGDGAKSYFCAELCSVALEQFISTNFPKEDFELAGLKKLHQLCTKLKFLQMGANLEVLDSSRN